MNTENENQDSKENHPEYAGALTEIYKARRTFTDQLANINFIHVNKLEYIKYLEGQIEAIDDQAVMILGHIQIISKKTKQ